MNDFRTRWGFELQRYQIAMDFPAPPSGLHIQPPPDLGFGPWKWSGDGCQVWVPDSPKIVRPNLVMDLAQEELIKRWRTISGSVRVIQGIGVGDGLVDPTRSDTALTNELGNKNIDSWDDSALTPTAGLSTTKAEVTWLSLEANGTLSEIGLFFDNGQIVTHALFLKLAMSGATQANPVRVTTSAAHGLSTGDEVHIDNVVGMTEINGLTFTITVFDADEFDLDGEDGTGHTAYVSGGDIWLVRVKTTGEVVQTNYIINVQS